MTGDTNTEESNLVQHAKRELELNGQLESDPEFAESLIAAVRGFTSFRHSGGSASVAVFMLQELLRHKPLTPLTDDPGEWQKVDEKIAGPEPLWQNVRNSACFSTDGGKTYYDVEDPMNSDQELPIYNSDKKEAPSA